MQSTIRIDRDVSMEMRDGTVLRADVYRPGDNEKHPVILMRTPYGKQQATDSEFLRFFDTVLAGYAIVVQDVRGRYASEGEYDPSDVYLTVEALDGYDTVEYVASQPWCDGNVGTAGGSYMGSLQWVLARENPPHLKAIAPWVVGVAGTSETLLRDGVIDLNEGTSWVLTVAMGTIEKLEKQGKDVSRIRQILNRAVYNPEEMYNFLPLKDIPHFNFEGVRETWLDRVLNPIPDPEFVEKVRPPYHKITVPCFHVGGWYDVYTRGTFENFLGMSEKGGSRLACEGQHMVIGPWTHFGPGGRSGVVGDIDFGTFASTRGSQLTQQNITFFNKYLKGMDIKVPLIHYFVMGRNIWEDADVWPPPQAKWQRCFLHSKGRANSSGGDGSLNWDVPGAEPADIFVYNPESPVQSAGGRGRAANGFVAGPMEQSLVEQRNDVLCYTTPELKEDMEVTGPIKFHLFASTSARDTDFTVKLVDVYPDGRAYNAADGVIRARYRKSYFAPELVKPGEVNEYVIDMGHISQLFRKGHRVRIDISSSNFPWFDRNMNTGNPRGEDAKGIPAMQTIYHEHEYPSHIDLPVMGASL
ncbi:CocE/NonD family hydrolase [Thermodesulfobacteriota bacterium]